MKLWDYAAYLDHAVLLPQSTDQSIDAACREAMAWGYGCLCVTPATLSRTVSLLGASGVNISSAIAFPHGTTTPTSKAFEAAESCRIGANEIDMVMNIGKAKMGQWAYVEDEIVLVKKSIQAVRNDAILKVIVETALLTEEEKVQACEACIRANADFIKTSTGFSGGGATAEDVRLFHAISAGRIRVKASGGVKTAASFLNMIEAGATRIGTIFSQDILNELVRDYGIEA